MADPLPAVADLTALLGQDRVIPAGRRVSKYLRDFSWYSPILESELADATVAAVALPETVDELREVVALAARHRVPVTMRGAGTGNYGQSLPLEHGIVVDIRGVAGVESVADGRVAVLPGTRMKDIEEAARRTGQELAVMPSTYRVATAAGFISGGSGGLGAAAHGDLWNNNVLGVDIITVEEEPRLLHLSGAQVNAVLHTYGTVGVIVKIEMRLVPAHHYGQYCVSFDSFDECAQFGWEVVEAHDIHARLASVHQAPLGAMMTPIAHLFSPAAHVALIWADREQEANLRALVDRRHGALEVWPEGVKDITQFPFSHSILWSRKAHPASSWLQCEYSTDGLAAMLTQIAEISDRYPGVFLQHIELIRSPRGTVRALGIPALVGLPNHGEALDDLISFASRIGMHVLNPHSFVVEEGGFVGDTEYMLELKRTCDPYSILNPGKLGSSFFEARAVRSGVPAERTIVAPENVAT
ncbi:FAD-binding oxidoreductase [soil metagenome]